MTQPAYNEHRETGSMRPLRHPVRSGDQFFFMHIPKTAGTTMIHVLQEYFKGQDFYLITERDNSTATLKPIETARMVRGHRTYSFLKYFARRPIVLTMLRHPHKRMLSNYSHLADKNEPQLKRIKQRLLRDNVDELPATFEEFALTPSMRNSQTQYLSGIRLKTLEEEQQLGPLMLEVAKLHLEWIAFFGLVERFDESLKLMRYTFDWPKVKDVEAQNVAPSGSKPPLSESMQTALEDANRLDMALYEYAAQMYEFRLGQMAKGQ